MITVELGAWRETLAAVRAGREPAESLPTPIRRRLFAELLDRQPIEHGYAAAVEAVAARTRTTSYTVARLLAGTG